MNGALLLPLSRAAGILGGPMIFKAGVCWFAIWTLISGLSPGFEVLIVCRCMQAIGSAAFLPTGIMLIGSTYRPGPRKNIIFSIYGCLAPLGFFVGNIVGSLVSHLSSWRWYYWSGAALEFVVVIVAFLSIPRVPGTPASSPSPSSSSAREPMDWWGCLTLAPGLILTVFALTYGPGLPQGFATPHIAICLSLGLLSLGAAFYIEGWYATNPILPFSLFKAPHMGLLTIALFLQYGVYGVWIYYASML